MHEADLMRTIQKEASTVGARLFRNNVGLYYTINGEPIRCGLCVGSSDLIGWKPIIVTKEMVDSKLLVFVAIEVKTDNGRVSKEQQSFIDAVGSNGGFSGIVRTPEDAKELLR
jgi:hypothetical protein